MKSYIAAAILTLCPQLRGEVSHDRMIAVLRQIEGGRIDDYGGPTHMARGTWYDHSPAPYEHSRAWHHCLPIYEAHIKWISRQLIRAGRRITPNNVALVWRYGLEGATRRKFINEYGQRASNLYAVTETTR